MNSWAGLGPVLLQDLCSGPLASPSDVKSMRLLLEQATLLLGWTESVTPATPQFEEFFVVIGSFLTFFVS